MKKKALRSKRYRHTGIPNAATQMVLDRGVAANATDRAYMVYQHVDVISNLVKGRQLVRLGPVQR